MLSPNTEKSGAFKSKRLWGSSIELPKNLAASARMSFDRVDWVYLADGSWGFEWILHPGKNL